MERNPVISNIKLSIAWLIHGWDRFFFQPVDSLPLSILRILCGCMLLYTHLVWGSALTEFFGSSGWNSPELISKMREGGVTPSLWWYVPDSWMTAVHWSCNLVILLFIVGFGGRFTAVLTWVIALSYAHRANLANFGLDQTNCILTFYLMIGPATQHLSVDRWISQRWFGLNKSILSLSSSACVSMRLIQLHLCVIYLWAGLGKLQGEAWWTGGAMWLAMANQEYQSLDMTWLASFPRLLELLTHTTTFWELFFVALVWPKPTRWIVLSIGAMMHLGIGAFLGMWTFGLIMIFSYVSFASGAWLRKLLRLEPTESESTAKTSHAISAENVAAQAASTLLHSSTVPSQHLPVSHGIVAVTHSHLPTHAKTVVLISTSQRAVDHWLQVNQQASVNWIVVSSIREAEPLSALFRQATFLMLEMRKLDNSELEYLAIRVVAKKRDSQSSDLESESHSKRAFPK